MYPCVVLQVQYIGKRSKTKMDLSKKMYADEVEVWFSNRSPATKNLYSFTFFILIKREKWQRKFSFHQMTEGQFFPKPHHPKGINTKYRHFLPLPLLSSKNPARGEKSRGVLLGIHAGGVPPGFFKSWSYFRPKSVISTPVFRSDL